MNMQYAIILRTSGELKCFNLKNSCNYHKKDTVLAMKMKCTIMFFETKTARFLKDTLPVA